MEERDDWKIYNFISETPLDLKLPNERYFSGAYWCNLRVGQNNNIISGFRREVSSSQVAACSFVDSLIKNHGYSPSTNFNIVVVSHSDIGKPHCWQEFLVFARFVNGANSGLLEFKTTILKTEYHGNYFPTK